MGTVADTPADTRDMMVGPATISSGGSGNDHTSEQATEMPCTRLDEHEQAQMVHQIACRSSIRAQMTAFHFNTLVPMEIILKFPLTQRTATMVSNLIVATRDMAQLSQMWSRLVGPAPSLLWLENANPLHILSDAEAQKICKLMEHGLHCWAYWSLATELSINGEETAMNKEWWDATAAKLDDMGRPNTFAVFQQLVVVGRGFIDIPRLESVMRKAKLLDLDLSIRRNSTRGMPETIHNDEVFELEAVDAKRKQVASIEQAHPQSEPGQLIPKCELIPTAIGLPEKEDTMEQTAHEEKPIPEDSSSSVEQQCDMEGSVSSTSNILEELNAALDEALDEVAISSFESSEGGSLSQNLLPSRAKINQAAQAKRDQITARHPHQWNRQVQHGSASSSTTQEHAWISADVLADYMPKDFNLEEPLPKESKLPGSPRMSQNVRGKLTVAQSQSTRVFPGQVGPRPRDTRQTLPRSFGPKTPISEEIASRVPSTTPNFKQTRPAEVQQRRPRAIVKTQGVSQARLTSHAVTRPAFLPATMKSSSMVAKAKPAPKTSQTLPRSFTTRPNSSPKPSDPAQKRNPARLEAARRILDASAKPITSSGAPRISLSGARPKPIATRVPLRPNDRPVMIVDTVAMSSGHTPKTEEGEAEASQSHPSSAVLVGITKLSSLGVSKIPVPRKKAIMPGTYPASDAGTDD